MMNKKLLALLLFLGFGMAVVYAIRSFPKQQRLPAAAQGEQRRNRPAQDKPSQPSAPPLAPKVEPPRYSGFHADLFRPLFDTPRPEPASVKDAGPPKTAQAPLPPPEPVKNPEPSISANLASFTYLGQVTDGNNRSIFLKGKQRVFVLKRGESFGEKQEFRLAEVSEKEIKIAMDDRTELIRIPLEEKKPLKSGLKAQAPGHHFPSPVSDRKSPVRKLYSLTGGEPEGDG